MATFNSVDTFRDPERIEIMSTLGKAATYLQQNYDKNTAETQALINQYMGMDLLRDVDKNYLGERVKSLVEYINTSGNRNWTKQSVARDVQNYIGTAIDKNVMAAVASTQAYRKLDAEIQQYKKSGKGYSIQNEWVSKLGLAEYMKGGLGEVFSPRTYTPYVDVNEKILKYTDKLKDFGMEYVPYSADAGGGGMFRMIGTREIISPQKVQQFLGSILNAQDLQQLSIDGMYSMKDMSTEEITSLYNGKIDDRIKALDTAIKDAKVDMISATDSEKKVLQSKIDEWENDKNVEINRKSKPVSREAMAAGYYQSNFFDNYSNFLSVNRVKDFKIDDSGFKMYKEQMEQERFNQTHALNLLKEQNEQAYRQARLALDAAAGGVKRNADGSYSLDPSLNPGISVTPSQQDLNTEERDGVYTEIYESSVKDWESVRSGVASNMSVINDIISKNPELSHIKGLDAGRIAGYLINSPGKVSTLLNNLPPDLKKQVQTANMNKKMLDNWNEPMFGTGGYLSSVSELAKGLTDKDTKSSVKNHANSALQGRYINDKGDLVQGNLTDAKGKYAELGRQVAIISNAITSSDSIDEKTQLRVMMNQLLGQSGLSYEQRLEISKAALKGNEVKIFDGESGKYFGKGIQDLKNSWEGKGGFWSGVGNIVRAGASAIGGTIANAGEKYIGDIFKINQNHRDYGGKSWFGIASEDLKVKGGVDSHISNMEQQLRAVQERVKRDAKIKIANNLNIDIDNKATKNLVEQIKMALPHDVMFNDNGHITISGYDKESGMVTVTAPVKNGKDTVAQHFPVPVVSLPSSLQSSIIDNDNRTSPYSAENPYSIGYSRKFSLPETVSQAQALKEGMSIQEIMSTPTVPTQKQIVVQALTGATPDIVKEHAKEIEEIVKANYEFKLEPHQGKWVGVVTKDGKHFYAEPTNIANYDPGQVRNLADKIIPAAIIQNIKLLTGNY